MSVGLRVPMVSCESNVGRAGSAPGCEGAEVLSGYSETKAWMCGTWDGEGLYGSLEPYFPGAANRSVRVARSDRWNGGKVLFCGVSWNVDHLNTSTGQLTSSGS